MADKAQAIIFDSPAVVLRSASTPSRLIWPRDSNYGNGFGFSDPWSLNFWRESSENPIPYSATAVAVLNVQGVANVGLRFWLLRNSSTLTAGTDTTTIRMWGFRAFALPNNIWGSCGQYFGEFTLGVNTKRSVNAALLPGAGSTDSAYADLITPTAGNPYTAIDTTLGANGVSRAMRFDMLGFPLLMIQGNASGANVGWNGEWWQY